MTEAWRTNADLCEAPGCMQRHTTTLSGDGHTLRGLGFTTAGTERLTVRVCARCYLLAMNEVMARAGVPKPEPPKVEYSCTACGRVVAPMEVRFHNGASPYHEPSGLGFTIGVPAIRHQLSVRVVK